MRFSIILLTVMLHINSTELTTLFTSDTPMAPIWNKKVRNVRKVSDTRANLIERLHEFELKEKRLENWENSLRNRENSVNDGLQLKENRLENWENGLRNRENIVKGKEKILNAREQRLDEKETQIAKMNEKNARKIKFQKHLQLDLFPNQSSIKTILNIETDEIIWIDPDNLVRNDVKEKIDIILFDCQNHESISNFLFDCISYWFNVYIPFEAHPFIQKLMLVISARIDVKRRGEHNRTPLMFAVYFDATEAAIQLLQRGANWKNVCAFGLTALHFAARFGIKQSCKILLQQGTGFNVQTKDGFTPLMYAAKNGHVEVVKMLLSLGANTNIKNDLGQTAMDMAKPICRDVIEAKMKGNHFKTSTESSEINI